MNRHHSGVIATFLCLTYGSVGCGDANTHFESRPGETRRINLTVEDSPDDTSVAGTSNDGIGGALDSTEAPSPSAVDQILDSVGDDSTSDDQSTSDADGVDGATDGVSADASGDGASGSEDGVTLPDGEDTGSGSGESPVIADADPGEDVPNAKERQACADLVGVPLQKVKVTGNQPDVRMTSDMTVAIKVTGNQASLDLNLAGSPGASIRGVCLFLAGNQAVAKVSANLDVGTLLYIGRGNRSEGDVVIQEGRELGRAYVDLGGNQAKLILSGDGTFSCPAARLRGNGSVFDCR